MIGAIIGDIVGSVYEFKHQKFNSEEKGKFPLFTKECSFTDDTVMTIAVAEALLNGGSEKNFIDSMKKFGRLYPNPTGGYGPRFGSWLFSDDRKPYNSFGNGSAMRVSPCAWFAKSLEEAEELAERSAIVTHNHPEGIKGAKAIAAAIYLVRTGAFAEGTSAIDIKCIVQDDFEAKVQAGIVPPMQTLRAEDMENLGAFLESNRDQRDPEESKKQIDAYLESLKHGASVRETRIKECRAKLREYLEGKYGYNLSRTLDEIRPSYKFNEICQETVPEAIIAFLESESFEDAIRNAVSLGGDADTLAAITGSIAEAEYGIEHDTLTMAISYLDDNLSSVINAWLDRGLPTGVYMVNNSGPLDYNHWGPREFSKPHKIEANIRISESQLARIRFGLWPEQMEDKWFIYFEDGRVCCHRSWTGHKIYEAKVKRNDSGYTIPEIIVERDAKLYSQTDDAEDVRGFFYLMGRGILGMEFDSPRSKGSGTDLLRDWGEFGRMMVTSPSVSAKLNEAIEEQIQRQQTAVPLHEDIDDAPDWVPPASSDSPEAHFLRAMYYQIDKEDLKGALAEYSEAIRLDPMEGNVWRNRGAAYSNRAELYRRMGEFDLAIADNNEAIRLEPCDHNWLIERGYTKYGLDDYAGAIEDYNRVISGCFFDLVLAYCGRSEAYKAMGDVDNAASDLAKAETLAREHNQLDTIEDFSKPEFADIKKWKAVKQQSSKESESQKAHVSRQPNDYTFKGPYPPPRDFETRTIWDPDDDALGLSPEDKEIVKRARSLDWNYHHPGITPEPPEAQAIFDKYLKARKP